MSDLISRQDAILALLEKGQRSRRYKLGEIWELNFDEIREALATAPSITCQECHHMAITAVREPEVGEPEPVGFLCRRWKRPTIPEGFCHKFIPKNQESDDASGNI